MTITHTYTGGGDFYPGLPAIDLDATALTPEQLAMLVEGIKRGMYAPKKNKPAPAETIKADEPAKILSEDTTTG